MLIGAGVALWWASGSDIADPAAGPASDLAPSDPPPTATRPPAPPAPRLPMPAPDTDPSPEPAADAPDTVEAQVHRAFAERAGLAMIRCPVPPHLRGGQPSGDHAPRIAEGWFTDLVREPSGQKVIYDRVIDPDAAREPLFVVAWDGTEGDLEIACTVAEAAWGSVRARVRFEDGPPPDAPLQVTGCGGGGDVDGDGVAVLEEVRAGLPCTLRLIDTRGLGCAGHVRLTPGPGVETPVDIDALCVDLEDPGPDDLLDLTEAFGITSKTPSRASRLGPAGLADLAEELLDDPAYETARPMLERIATYRRMEADFIEDLRAHGADAEGPLPRPPPFTVLP